MSNITLKHRTVRRDGYEWSIEIVLNKRHTPINKSAVVKRAGESWGVVQLYHSGKMTVIPLWPAKEFPKEVLTEIKHDLGVTV